jgi:hypothetical protein
MFSTGFLAGGAIAGAQLDRMLTYVLFNPFETPAPSFHIRSD